MIATELQKEIISYIPALMINRVFPTRVRSYVKKILVLFIVFFILIEFILLAVKRVGSIIEPGGILTVLFTYNLHIHSLLLFLLSLGFLFLMVESFYNSAYFRGIDAIFHENSNKNLDTGITYEVADVLVGAYNDITKAFSSSIYGKEIFARCDISAQDLNVFLRGERQKITPKILTFPTRGFLTIEMLAQEVFKQDKSLSTFLFGKGVSDTIYIGAVKWTSRSINERKHSLRWWARDHLEQIEGIGRSWSYGGAYELERFAKDLSLGSVFSSLTTSSEYAKEKVEQIATILSRAKEANALLVGEEGVGKKDIITAFKRKIVRGEVPALTDKQIRVLDTEALIALHGNKQSFEKEFLKLLSQAVSAGNIILVIENLPAFLASAESLGSDPAVLMDEYISSPDLQVIATSDPVSFHQSLETKQQLLQRFEEVQIENPDRESLIHVVEDVARDFEKIHKVLFTYSAIQAVVESADRYIVGGVMPDKAVDLLVEIVPIAEAKGVKIITKEVVESYIKEKTGIPIGEITEKERDVLLNLEDILHKRIVGQDMAVDTISNAMRRARAGIQNPKRPVGSFLFLGPTGVGKTETTKALAEVFFGDENKMLRIDMSEYSSDDSLAHLIGSLEDNTVGTLVTLLKEHPHGVLLLDEFEKTTPDVMDLFLQILDEGYFTSSRGERINARNLIIIATSNAGSDLIWELSKKNKKLSDVKEEIIDSIIERGIYKPELINRFDGVILFHTLKVTHLKIIARLMLKRLQQRIKKQGYKLIINDSLVDILIKEGFSPQFGARPMRRVIQDKIEKLIAEKIIEGALNPGSSIEFSKEDFI